MMAPSKVWKAGILKPELAHKEPPEKGDPTPEEESPPQKLEVVTPEELELPAEVSDLEKALTQ
eukprot:4612451-Amphidinium_carterae.1